MDTTPKLYSLSDLCERYAPLSQNGKALSKNTIFKWRKQKDFPNPIIRNPSSIWDRAEVHAWELANNFGFLHQETATA